MALVDVDAGQGIAARHDVDDDGTRVTGAATVQRML